jgi:hypothetical protein
MDNQSTGIAKGEKDQIIRYFNIYESILAHFQVQIGVAKFLKKSMRQIITIFTLSIVF